MFLTVFGFSGSGSLVCLHLAQPAFRSTSSTASGCFAMTARSTRVGASGRDLPCSQFLSVAGRKPNFVANCAWLRPIFVRTSLTSTPGPCTSVTRTFSFSQCLHAIACSSPSLLQPLNDACADGGQLFHHPAPPLRRALGFRLRFHCVLLSLRRVPSHQDRNQPLHRVAF